LSDEKANKKKEKSDGKLRKSFLSRGHSSARLAFQTDEESLVFANYNAPNDIEGERTLESTNQREVGQRSLDPTNQGQEGERMNPSSTQKQVKSLSSHESSHSAPMPQVNQKKREQSSSDCPSMGEIQMWRVKNEDPKSNVKYTPTIINN